MFSLKTKVFQLSNVIRVLYYHDFDADLKKSCKSFLKRRILHLSVMNLVRYSTWKTLSYLEEIENEPTQKSASKIFNCSQFELTSSNQDDSSRSENIRHITENDVDSYEILKMSHFKRNEHCILSMPSVIFIFFSKLGQH